MRIVFLLLFLGSYIPASWGQPWPGIPESGSSDAISSDDVRFIGWADSVVKLERGPMQLEQPQLGLTTVGEPQFAVGSPDNLVISLGDGGSVTLGFEPAISDGNGPDFAVFENSFSDFFLELATVSVSSNGQDFFEFPHFSETDTSRQVNSFDSIQPTNIHGFAGKYRSKFGTPFDLKDLPESPLLDVNQIRFVKITDVVGSINPGFCTRDSKGRIINDPYPTPYPSGGFDLDAVGVLNQRAENGGDFVVWGNVVSNGSKTNIKHPGSYSATVFNQQGKLVDEFFGNPGENQMSFSFASGLYLLKLQSQTQNQSFKILVL